MSEEKEKALPCPRIVRGQQELTAEQQAYARHFVEARIADMLDTQPVDEAEAEAHLRQAYQVAGLEPPALIRWFDSPLAFFQAQDRSRHNTSHSIMGYKVSDSIKYTKTVRDTVEDRVKHSVPDSLWNSLWKSVQHKMVRDTGRRGVSSSVVRSIKNHLGTPVEMKCLLDSMSAYDDACELACALFLHEVFEPNNLIHFAHFNELVSGYHLGKDQAWLVHKPVRRCCDEQGRLHDASGMCMQYRDGWGIYAWHSVFVPEKVILHPDQLTKEDWLRERNLEVRRVMQERMGMSRFIFELGGTCIDEGSRGTLIAVDLFDDPEGVAHYVRVRDGSSEREYYLRVPPSIRRADEAIAWTFGLDEQDYHPVQET